jgi:hypothetical protein
MPVRALTPGKGPPMVGHFRQTFLWPIYLLPIKADTQVQDHCAYLLHSVTGSPWQEVADEFTGEPEQFQERHYNEFVTFLPPVQRFLYGQGLGKAVGKGYGESPIRVLRRCDIAAVRVTLTAGAAPIIFKIAHVDLYFFYDIDLAALAGSFLRRHLLGGGAGCDVPHGSGLSCLLGRGRQCRPLPGARRVVGCGRQRAQPLGL